MDGIRRMRGPSIGRCDQETLSDSSSHNTQGHSPGIGDTQSFVDNIQQPGINPSGVDVLAPICEM